MLFQCPSVRFYIQDGNSPALIIFQQTQHRFPDIVRFEAFLSLLRFDANEMPPSDFFRQFPDSADKDHLSFFEYRNAIAQALDFRHIVTCEDDRFAPAFQLSYAAMKRESTFYVQSRRRFVEENDLGIADQRQRKMQASLLSRG